jgi:hypothetical protein
MDLSINDLSLPSPSNTSRQWISGGNIIVDERGVRIYFTFNQVLVSGEGFSREIVIT